MIQLAILMTNSRGLHVLVLFFKVYRRLQMCLRLNLHLEKVEENVQLRDPSHDGYEIDSDVEKCSASLNLLKLCTK